MNMTMALVWVGTGALLVGAAMALATRRQGGGTRLELAGLFALGSFVACFFWLLLPVHAFSTGIDSAGPHDIDCWSARSSLQGSAYVRTDVGPVFSPAHAACQAASWERVASLGTIEVGVAVILGAGSLVTFRRGTPDSRHEADRVPV